MNKLFSGCLIVIATLLGVFAVVSIALSVALSRPVVNYCYEKSHLTEAQSRYLKNQDAYTIITDKGEAARLRAQTRVTRSWLAGSPEELPRDSRGQLGYDKAQYEHLVTVKVLVDGVLLGGSVALGILLVLAIIVIARKRFNALFLVMRSTGATLAVLLVACIAMASLGFTRFFEWFHKLLFPGGNYSFYADTLLIRAFPEKFWMAEGAALALVLAIFAGVLLLLGFVYKSVLQSRDIV